MEPDLITSCIGMNDVTRPGRSFGRALADLDFLHDRLAESGATVVTTTFPDLARILPVGRLIAARVVEINHVIRTAATRHGFRLVDLYGAPSMTDPETWSSDRVHGSTKGARPVRRRSRRGAGTARQQPRLGRGAPRRDPAGVAVAHVLAGHVGTEPVDAVAVASLQGAVRRKRSWPQTPGPRGPSGACGPAGLHGRVRGRRVGRAESVTARCRSGRPRRAEDRDGQAGEHRGGPERHACNVGHLSGGVRGGLAWLRQHRAHRLTQGHRIGGVGHADPGTAQRIDERVVGRVRLRRRCQRHGREQHAHGEGGDAAVFVLCGARPKPTGESCDRPNPRRPITDPSTPRRSGRRRR